MFTKLSHAPHITLLLYCVAGIHRTNQIQANTLPVSISPDSSTETHLKQISAQLIRSTAQLRKSEQR
jgi:hypothetical protein